MSALPVRLNHGDLERVPLDWTVGSGLSSGRSILVPADLVRRRMWRDAPRPDVFHVTSNGLAAGNTIEEATLHGLFEVIERDVLQRDYLGEGRRRTLIDPLSVLDGYCRGLVHRFLSVGMFLEITLVDSAYGIPVCAAYIWSEDYPLLFAGSGCHRDPHIALSRALTEAAQSRLTCIAGTRDDLDSHENAFAAHSARPEPAGPHTADWNAHITHYTPCTEDFGTEAVSVARQVAAVTGHEPVAVRLGQSDAYAGVKIIAPGLRMRLTRAIPRLRRNHG